jgi:competence CoiA-like predicted nuclease
MINKNIGSINFKDWHNTTQAHLAKDFEKQGYAVTTETRIPTVGGHKSWRRADIVIPELKLIVEVQKSKNIAKDWIERNEDYELAGYRTTWVMHDNRWQPDSDQNTQLEDEDGDIYIKWRDYDLSQHRPQYIYNSARFAIIDYKYNNPDVTILYAIPTAGQSSLMYRKVESVEEVKRKLTPKFTDNKHFGINDYKNHAQPPEDFDGYKVITSIIAKDTFKLNAA